MNAKKTNRRKTGARADRQTAQSSPTAGRQATFERACRQHRNNLLTASRLINELFEELQQSPPDEDRVACAAGLAIVQGAIVASLAAAEDPAPETLARLSRIVAEQHRARTGRPKPALRRAATDPADHGAASNGQDDADPGPGILSPKFAQAIEAVYGITLPKEETP